MSLQVKGALMCNKEIGLENWALNAQSQKAKMRIEIAFEI